MLAATHPACQMDSGGWVTKVESLEFLPLGDRSQSNLHPPPSFYLQQQHLQEGGWAFLPVSVS